MKMIHKYKVSDFRQTYTIPKDSDFISVVLAPKGDIALYFAVDPKVTELDTRTFWVVATGRMIPHDSKFLGTVEQDGLNLHVFELFNRHERKVLNINRRKNDDS